MICVPISPALGLYVDMDTLETCFLEVHSGLQSLRTDHRLSDFIFRGLIA
ncbi:unnamed protein product [Ectocarpus sp. CCAP 1310/34]|nr:unnamed protein product [Ectocarpus sp. CCAP 1310/34]